MFSLDHLHADVHQFWTLLTGVSLCFLLTHLHANVHQFWTLLTGVSLFVLLTHLHSNVLPIPFTCWCSPVLNPANGVSLLFLLTHLHANVLPSPVILSTSLQPLYHFSFHILISPFLFSHITSAFQPHVCVYLSHFIPVQDSSCLSLHSK